VAGRGGPPRPLVSHGPGRRLLRLENSRVVAEPLAALFRCCSGFRTSWAQSRKICAIGLIVRFFKVITPSGQVGTGSSTGKTLSGGRFPKLQHRLRNGHSPLS
jgi:hypothetical protein